MEKKGAKRMILEHTARQEAPLGAILRRELGLSSTLVKRLKWQGAFFLNGLPAHTDARVRPGDTVRVEMNESPTGFDPEPMALEILYEDESLLAVDKPAGMLVHPSPQRNSGTLANGVLYHFACAGERAGVHPVTRLDRDTMGVVLFAKSAHVHGLLCAMLRAGQIEKTYFASVYGVPQAPEGRIELPVWKPGGGSLIRTVDPRGQHAVTDYRLLASDGTCALLELHPRTGRTHQLRLHCMASGFPILGDPQYASEASAAFSRRLGLTTQQLVAGQLAFAHPMTGRALRIVSGRTPAVPEGAGFANGAGI